MKLIIYVNCLWAIMKSCQANIMTWEVNWGIKICLSSQQKYECISESGQIENCIQLNATVEISYIIVGIII